MRSCVVIPTYNEKENIEDVISKVLENDIDILVVDDSSPDGTGKIVQDIATKHNGRVKLETRTSKQGLGKAYVFGFTKCIDDGYDIICQMDADLSHDPKVLPTLIKSIENGTANLTIGSRYVNGGVIPNWSLFRRFLSRGGNLYTRLMLKIKVKDATSGFRAYKSDLLKDILSLGILSDGYGFQIEMTYCATKLGAKIKEVPITFTDRIKGNSKMGGVIILEALKKVTLWSLRDRIWMPLLNIFGHKVVKSADKNIHNQNINNEEYNSKKI
jgi:dolichol-phosphate mannosyltransferase